MYRLIWMIIIVLVVILIGIIAWRSLTTPNTAVQTGSSAPPAILGASTTVPVAGSGERCGGNMQNAPTCVPGYHCAPDPNSHLPFGDVGGTCVPNPASGGKG